jgi:hypothetical protein
MTRRNQIIIGVAVLVILILAVFGVRWLAQQQAPEVAPVEQAPVELPLDTSIIEQEGDIRDSRGQVDLTAKISDEVAAEQELQASVRSIGIVFLERFGSYTTQNEAANIIELQPFMTDSFKDWADSLIERQAESNGTFESVRTKVIATQFTQLDEEAGQAEIEFNTQRTKQTGIQANQTVEYQKAKVLMVKEGDSWLVDELRWQ